MKLIVVAQWMTLEPSLDGGFRLGDFGYYQGAVGSASFAREVALVAVTPVLGWMCVLVGEIVVIGEVGVADFSLVRW